MFVFGSFLINFLDAFPPPYTVDRLLVGGFHLIVLAAGVHLRPAEGAVADQLALFRPRGRVRPAARAGVAHDDARPI